MKHIVIENNGYTTQMYKYKDFKIFRSHSSEEFRLTYDGYVYRQNDVEYDKYKRFTLKKIQEMIDNNTILDNFKPYIKERRINCDYRKTN